jgi:hypothetical protein
MNKEGSAKTAAEIEMDEAAYNEGEIVDVQKAKSAAVSKDGWAHFISRYDGDYETTADGVVYFRE